MKILVVIGLAVLLLVLLYWRLRPYLKLLRNFLHAVREIQQGFSRPSHPDQVTDQHKLLQCEACGTWVPGDRTLASSSGGVFCSPACERSGRKDQRAKYRAAQTGTHS